MPILKFLKNSDCQGGKFFQASPQEKETIQVRKNTSNQFKMATKLASPVPNQATITVLARHTQPHIMGDDDNMKMPYLFFVTTHTTQIACYGCYGSTMNLLLTLSTSPLV